MRAEEIEAALVERVKPILAKKHGKPFQTHYLGVDVEALIQALGELLADDRHKDSKLADHRKEDPAE